MRCCSCGVDIPPTFTAVLQRNECPACSGPIMDDTARQLMSDLAEAMERMPNDPKGLAGWLLSNYRLRKIGDGEPVGQFYHEGARRQQPAGQPGNDIDTSNLRQAQSPVDQFLSRTDSYNKVKETRALIEAAKGGKDKRMAALAAGIQHAQATDEYGLVGQQDVEIDDPQADNEDMEAYQQMMRGGGNPFVQANVNPMAMVPMGEGGHADIGEEDPMESPLLPHEKQMASTPQGQKVMLENRLKRAKAQAALRGGGDGAFSRSS